MPEIRNPNLEPHGSGGGGGASGGDFRSLILFAFLALAALMAFQFFKKPEPNTPPQQNQQAQQQTPQQSEPASAARPAATVSAGKNAAGVPAVTASSETTTTIENEKFRITFTNKGGQVQHWILKGFVDSMGKPLDIVQQQAASRFGQPLSLYTYDNALTTELNTALYKASATGHLLAPNSITFQYASNGLDVVKTFS